MHGTLEDEAVVAQELTVVRGEYDKRILGNPDFLERAEQAPQLVVDQRHHAVIGRLYGADSVFAQVRIAAQQKAICVGAFVFAVEEPSEVRWLVFELAFAAHRIRQF